MKTLLFAVNKGHKRFFEAIKPHLSCESDIVFSQRVCLISFRAFKHLKEVDFSAPIMLRVKDYQAKATLKLPTAILKAYYTFMAYRNYLRYFQIIKERAQYDKIVLWNGLSFRQAIMLEIAKLYDITPYYIENGLMPKTIVLDPQGVNAYNSVPREKSFYEAYRKTHENLPTELIQRQAKNSKKFETKEVELPKKYLFIPFQLDHDTQILIHSPWITSMEYLFRVFEEMQLRDPDLHIVFKEHPSNKHDYPTLHTKANTYDHIHIINSYPTQHLITHAQAVITVNSTVGIESLLLGKRVIVLGNAFYAIEGVTKQAQSEKELKEIIDSLNSWEREDKIVENFLHFLYYDYLIPGTFKEQSTAQYKKINEVLECPKES